MLRRNIGRTAAATGLVAVLGVASAVSAQAYYTTELLQAGSRGDGVKCVQFELKYHYGLTAAQMPIDGDYGTKTIAQVQRLQRDGHLDPDGKVGRVTGQLIWNGIKVAASHGSTINIDCFWKVPTSSHNP